jgi:putative chitinase
MITLEELVQIFPKTPRTLLASFVSPLNDCFEKWGIGTLRGQAAFLGVYGHECTNFQRLEENLNYSADGLANTWPARYAARGKDGTLLPKVGGRYTPGDLAKRLARNPIAIANNVYANRMGNGNESSGDGWRFRGGGVSMLTGRNNYQNYSDATGVDAVGNPGIIRQPAGATDPAGWFWYANGINRFAEANDFDGVCDQVNLGRQTAAEGDAIGFAERKKTHDLARKVMGVY